MNNIELINEAKKAMEMAYAPFSGFKVGAAILTDDLKVYTGCNVENSTYGATICAERTAAVKAVSEGSTRFVKIAIVSSGEDFTYPCGICRQFLAEFSDNLLVVLCNSNGEIKEEYLSALLPNAFKM
jgi:cytidine deaminase